MTVSDSGRAQVAVALPIERVVDDDALRRADDAVVGRQEIAGQGAGVRIDQPRLAIEPLAVLGIERAVGLKVIELPGLEAGNEHAPDVAPAIGLAVEVDDFGRLAIVDPLYSSTRIAVAERLKTTNCTPFSCRIAP